jgi:hypothetical protein
MIISFKEIRNIVESGKAESFFNLLNQRHDFFLCEKNAQVFFCQTKDFYSNLIMALFFNGEQHSTIPLQTHPNIRYEQKIIYKCAGIFYRISRMSDTPVNEFMKIDTDGIVILHNQVQMIEREQLITYPDGDTQMFNLTGKYGLFNWRFLTTEEMFVSDILSENFSTKKK